MERTPARVILVVARVILMGCIVPSRAYEYKGKWARAGGRRAQRSLCSAHLEHIWGHGSRRSGGQGYSVCGLKLAASFPNRWKTRANLPAGRRVQGAFRPVVGLYL